MRLISTFLLFIGFLMLGIPTFAQRYGAHYVGKHFKKDKALTAQLHQFLEKRNFKGDVGIYVYNLKDRREAAIHADTIFPTASIIKVPILINIFKKIVDKELTYHQPLMYRDSIARGGSGLLQYFKDSTKLDLSKIVRLMIAHSDNTAAIWCQQLAGGGASINRWLAEHDYKFTRVNSRTKGREEAYDKYGWGQTTPREMANLLIAIRKKYILTSAACERMYRDMSGVYWDDYALSQIPPYVQTASKQGMVNASRSELVMVNAPHGDYVFYIATKNNKDQRWSPDNEAWQLARDVSKLLWNYYEPKSEWEMPKGAAIYWDWH